jgi:hypothetical protein
MCVLSNGWIIAKDKSKDVITFNYYPIISLEENYGITRTRWPISGPRFQLCMSRILSRSANHLATTEENVFQPK